MCTQKLLHCICTHTVPAKFYSTKRDKVACLQQFKNRKTMAYMPMFDKLFFWAQSFDVRNQCVEKTMNVWQNSQYRYILYSSKGLTNSADGFKSMLKKMGASETTGKKMCSSRILSKMVFILQNTWQKILAI